MGLRFQTMSFPNLRFEFLKSQILNLTLSIGFGHFASSTLIILSLVSSLSHESAIHFPAAPWILKAPADAPL